MLLLLAVGVFVAIWSGDRRRPGWVRGDASIPGRRANVLPSTVSTPMALQGAIVKGEPVAEARRPHPMVAAVRRPSKAVAVLGNQADGPGRPSYRLVLDSTGTVNIPESPTHNADVPLPGGITPGEYRVVRSDGRVLELRLTLAELSRRGIPQIEPPRSLYLLHDGRIRWYFIRVETAKTEIVHRPAARATTNEVPRVARDVLLRWWARLGQVHVPAVDQLRFGWDALRTAALQAIADLARRSKNAFADAVDQLRQAAVRMRRVAAESRPARR
jgi:hypothetical protein